MKNKIKGNKSHDNAHLTEYNGFLSFLAYTHISSTTCKFERKSA